MSVVPARRSLNTTHWAEAALDAVSEGGVEAVAVEPLARRLGVTKGSFYWHFENRDSLVQHALELWERRETEDIIEQAERQSTASERIHTLFRIAANTDPRSEHILLALAASEHPVARACVQRISERWREYVEACYLALGLPPAEARNWTTFAYSTFMGTLRMRRDDPKALPEGPLFNDYVRFLIRSLIPPGTETVNVGEHPSVVPLRQAGQRG
jgi:AcrR family transcriptional regulator